MASGFHKLLYAQNNIRQHFGNCKTDYLNFSNLYSCVFSDGVTLGKSNSGTVVSGQDERLQFQLRGIYRSPLTKQNVFFSQCITLALRHHIALFRPNTCFISIRRFLILANRVQIEFSDPFQGGCLRRL